MTTPANPTAPALITARGAPPRRVAATSLLGHPHTKAQKGARDDSDRTAAHAHVGQANLRGKKALKESDQAKPSI